MPWPWGPTSGPPHSLPVAKFVVSVLVCTHSPGVLSGLQATDWYVPACAAAGTASESVAAAAPASRRAIWVLFTGGVCS